MCIGGTRGRLFLRVNQIPKPHTNIARAIESSEQIFSAFLSKGKREKKSNRLATERFHFRREGCGVLCQHRENELSKLTSFKNETTKAQRWALAWKCNSRPLTPIFVTVRPAGRLSDQPGLQHADSIDHFRISLQTFWQCPVIDSYQGIDWNNEPITISLCTIQWPINNSLGTFQIKVLHLFIFFFISSVNQEKSNTCLNHLSIQNYI